MGRRLLATLLAAVIAAAPAAAQARDVVTTHIGWLGAGDEPATGLLLRPADLGRAPAVLVIAPPAQAADAARRLADAGFLVLIPDLTDAPSALAALRYVARDVPLSTGRVGAIGLGPGAATVADLARTAGKQLRAAVVAGPAPGDLPKSVLVVDPAAWTNGLDWLTDRLH